MKKRKLESPEDDEWAIVAFHLLNADASFDPSQSAIWDCVVLLDQGPGPSPESSVGLGIDRSAEDCTPRSAYTWYTSAPVCH
jgi:hypothetical protein